MAFPDAGTAIKTLTWGKMPKGTAGTKFKKAAALTLTAKGANGKAITGTYSKPITLTNTDKTGATKLLINGKPASSKVTVKKSTDKITLSYTGLAIAPAEFKATAKGVKKAAKATFAPSTPGIAYSGPTVGGAPEIDLTTTTSGQTGYSGSFGATQTGWASGSFNNAYKYAFTAISGQTNNCSGSYTVSPGSGVKGTAFTVTAASTAAAGECLMTITGGAGKTLGVTLTFTTTGVVINSQPR